MIFYFSATGNCKHVALKIAGDTGDKAVSIQEIIGKENGKELDLSSEKFLGFVSPTYAFGLPLTVKDFLENTGFKVSSDCYVYFISTYGTTPGISMVRGRSLLKKKGIAVDSVFSIKMPDTWTPIFNLSDSEKVQEINRKAEEETAGIIQEIKAGKKHSFARRQLPYIVSPFAKAWYECMRKTKKLYVEDSCAGCGACAKKCPVQAIEMINGKPVWKKEKCAMCLGCLHRCPVFAIQYGNGATKKHGQYRNPYSRV